MRRALLVASFVAFAAGAASWRAWTAYHDRGQKTIKFPRGYTLDSNREKQMPNERVTVNAPNEPSDEFELVQSPILRKLTFKLDRFTGEIWQYTCESDDGRFCEWAPMQVLVSMRRPAVVKRNFTVRSGERTH